MVVVWCEKEIKEPGGSPCRQNKKMINYTDRIKYTLYNDQTRHSFYLRLLTQTNMAVYKTIIIKSKTRTNQDRVKS